MFRLSLHLHGAQVNELELVPGQEYTFGRGSSCDIVLEEQPGISRSHFRVREENGQWTAQVISKFGSLIYAGQPIQTLPLDVGTVFKVGSYDFKLLAQAEEKAQNDSRSGFASGQEPLSNASGQSHFPSANLPATTSQDRLPQPPSEPEFEGNEEATRIVSSIAGAPYLRIVEPSGEEEILCLEGRKWIAGRETGCEILLNDRKASRRQFELTSSHQGFFVRDLGSSNGTLLNGIPLAPDELKPIRSGDALTVGGVVLHFELRDPHFDKRLMVIPPEVISGSPAIIQNPYELINYPVTTGPGGAVRVNSPRGIISGYAEQFGLNPSSMDDSKRKKMRFYMIIAIVLLPLLAILIQDGEPEKKPAAVDAGPFSRLSPQKQQVVKETFILAKNLYIQGKLELAAEQLSKLHEIIPEGYENSLSMAEDCRAAAEQAERLRFIAAERKRQSENNRKIEENLRYCQNLANTTMNLEEVRRCLSPTIDLDPSHPKINELISLVQMRITENNERAEERREYEERVSRGRSLYYKAERLKESNKYLAAIDAYKKHIDSSYPDPDNLKAKSQRTLVEITRNIEKKVDEAVQAAASAYASKNYKEALELLINARDLDPNSEKVAKNYSQYRREVTLKMREMYQESVIAEGIGNVPQAKELWQKIIDTDHPQGEYYKKARTKLRSYGSI